MGTDFGRLADADRGFISKRIFIEREIYERELERIFARCWFFLCYALWRRALGGSRAVPAAPAGRRRAGLGA
jgi:hypothetical protein